MKNYSLQGLFWIALVGWIPGGDPPAGAQPTRAASSGTPPAARLLSQPPRPERTRFVSRVPPGKVPRGRRSEAATRSLFCPRRTAEPLTALVPEGQLAWTAGAFPTFWFYVPYTQSEGALQLELTAGGSTAYRGQFALPSEAGIVGLQLPLQALPLRLETLYRWQLTVLCAGAEDPVLYGYLQRRRHPGNLTAGVGVQVSQFARSGFWFDALTLLAQQLQQQTTDSSTYSQWRDLLSTDGVNLSAWTDFRVLQCCRPRP